MARIRSIKPEFWDDEKVGALSPLARLLFIGSWNLADDNGVVRWSADYLNASLFMYDGFPPARVAKLMAEVEEQGMAVPYTANRTTLAIVSHFERHQKINRRQKGRHPFPPSDVIDSLDEDVRSALTGSVSGSPPSSVNDSPPDREGIGREHGAGNGAGNARASGAPREFLVTDELRTWAASHAPTIDLDAETAKFIDHHRAKGSTMRDWTAAWRTWMRRAVGYQKPLAASAVDPVDAELLAYVQRQEQP